MLCEKCDIDLSTCPHGNASAAAAEAEVLEASGVRVSRSPLPLELVANGPTIIATQKSPCPGCGDWIEEGESITHTEHGWAHSEEVSAKAKPPGTPTSIFDGIE